MSVSSINRRDLLKAGAVAAAAMPLTSAVALADAVDAEGNLIVPSFLVKPEPITEFAQTYEHDVVVVGAGEAGLSAAHTALEGGCSVACVQNINAPLSTGNMGASVDLTQTDEAGVQACVSFLLEKNAYRSNR